MYRLEKLSSSNRQFLSDAIKTIEGDIYYPLGDDHFKIDHGDDYFAFFERLGELHYWTVFDGALLVGVAAGILRTINGKKTWYLCDLKVIKSYRGKGVPRFMFKNAFVFNCKKERVFRAYAVSMNSRDAKMPFHKIKRATFGLLKVNSILNIYSFDVNDYNKLSYLFTEYMLVNTTGKKELILKSNNETINLNHLNRIDLDGNSKTLNLSDDAVIMVSVKEDSTLDKELQSLKYSPSSDATVLTFRIKDNFEIFTDEI